jgi:hypothetical protein
VVVRVWVCFGAFLVCEGVRVFVCLCLCVFSRCVSFVCPLCGLCGFLFLSVFFGFGFVVFSCAVSCAVCCYGTRAPPKK